jgi:DNA-directed RNA polymerase specialized sigma subunit
MTWPISIDDWVLDSLTEDDLPVPLEAPTFTQVDRDQAMSMVTRFGDLDYDIVNLYFYYGFSQSRISLILFLSQGDVSYRLKRAVEILKLKTSDAYCRYEELLLRSELKFTELDKQMLDMYLFLRNQTAVANRLSVSQSTVSKRILRIKKNLEECGVVLF